MNQCQINVPGTLTNSLRKSKKNVSVPGTTIGNVFFVGY